MTGSNAYRNHQVNTSTPLELILLAYQVLEQSLVTARQARMDKDYALEAASLTKALRALSELILALDFDAGGELAANLGSLYAYMTKKISMTATETSLADLDEVLSLTRTLQSGWQGLKASAGVVPGAATATDSSPMLAAA